LYVPRRVTWNGRSLAASLATPLQSSHTLARVPYLLLKLDHLQFVKHTCLAAPAVVPTHTTSVRVPYSVEARQLPALDSTSIPSASLSLRCSAVASPLSLQALAYYTPRICRLNNPSLLDWNLLWPPGALLSVPTASTCTVHTRHRQPTVLAPFLLVAGFELLAARRDCWTRISSLDTES